MSIPRRKNTTLMPVSGRVSATKPSADISSVNPKWVVRNRAEAATSSTFSDTAEAVIFMSTTRPPLGPGLMAKYEHELAAFDGLGLDDIQMDAALTHLLTFVQAWAQAAAAAQSARG